MTLIGIDTGGTFTDFVELRPDTTPVRNNWSVLAGWRSTVTVEIPRRPGLTPTSSAAFHLDQLKGE